MGLPCARCGPHRAATSVPGPRACWISSATLESLQLRLPRAPQPACATQRSGRHPPSLPTRAAPARTPPPKEPARLLWPTSCASSKRLPRLPVEVPIEPLASLAPPTTAPRPRSTCGRWSCFPAASPRSGPGPAEAQAASSRVIERAHQAREKLRSIRLSLIFSCVQSVSWVNEKDCRTSLSTIYRLQRHHICFSNSMANT